MKRYLIWFDVAIYLVVAALVFGFRPRTHQYWIGLALFLFGLAFWVTARLQLGRSFAVTAKAKQLVTHGLYSRIRHPIYFFAGIALLGILLAAQNWTALVVGLLLYSAQIFRVKRTDFSCQERRSSTGKSVWRGISAVSGAHLVLATRALRGCQK